MADEIPAEVRQARLDVAQLRTQRAGLLRDAARAGSLDRGQLGDLDREIAGRLDDVFDLIDPCDAAADVPLVLMPVRIETRFDAKGARITLKVRIYPDEIHVDDVARGLTDEETAAAKAYWTSVWTEPVPDTAWPALVKAVGAKR